MALSTAVIVVIAAAGALLVVALVYFLYSAYLLRKSREDLRQVRPREAGAGACAPRPGRVSGPGFVVLHALGLPAMSTRRCGPYIGRLGGVRLPHGHSAVSSRRMSHHGGRSTAPCDPAAPASRTGPLRPHTLLTARSSLLRRRLRGVEPAQAGQ